MRSSKWTATATTTTKTVNVEIIITTIITEEATRSRWGWSTSRREFRNVDLTTTTTTTETIDLFSNNNQKASKEIDFLADVPTTSTWIVESTTPDSIKSTHNRDVSPEIGTFWKLEPSVWKLFWKNRAFNREFRFNRGNGQQQQQKQVQQVQARPRINRIVWNFY